MSEVPSAGWREMYRWCGVSPFLEEREERRDRVGGTGS